MRANQFTRQTTPRADGVAAVVEDHYHLTNLRWRRLALTADAIMWPPRLRVTWRVVPTDGDLALGNIFMANWY
jgi:hypothetical protein